MTRASPLVRRAEHMDDPGLAPNDPSRPPLPPHRPAGLGEERTRRGRPAPGSPRPARRPRRRRSGTSGTPHPGFESVAHNRDGLWGRTVRPPVPVRTTRGSAPVAAKTRRPAATERERDATRPPGPREGPDLGGDELAGRRRSGAPREAQHSCSSIILNGSPDRCLERCARKRSVRPSCRNRATKLLLVALN